MTDKTRSLAEVVEAIEDGMTIGIGGWGARRKPMAFVRELCRSSVKDLTLVSFGGPDVGLLCAAGKVDRVVYGFVSLDVVALDPYFRRARERGEVAARELDEGMLYWSIYAAALRLPFLPIRAGFGSDVMSFNPDLRTVASPYGDGEELVAMPALNLDVAVIHANRADARGNAQVLGPDPHFDELLCLAAAEAYVTAEQIVRTEDLLSEGCIHSLHVNRSAVTGVAEVPFGAHPTSCVPDYDLDADHIREYARSATDPESERAYLAFYVDVLDHAEYLAAVGGEAKIRLLTATSF